MTVLSGLGSDTTTMGTGAIEVIDGGPFTTVQDVPGRIGSWHVGVPPNGPMDDLAHRLVNRVLGNRPHAAALELTTQGPTLRFTDDATIAVGGAPMPIHVDGRRADLYSPIEVRAGATVIVGATAGLGMRATLGVRGGIGVTPFLGSRSTFTLGAFGGHEGRTITRGRRRCLGDRRRRPRCRRRGRWHRAWRPCCATTGSWACSSGRTPPPSSSSPDGRRGADPHHVGGPLQLGPHRRAPGGPEAALGPTRRRGCRAAPVEHPRHRLRHRLGRPDRRHADHPRTRWTQPRRVRVPAGRRRLGAMEAGPARARRPRAPRRVVREGGSERRRTASRLARARDCGHRTRRPPGVERDPLRSADGAGLADHRPARGHHHRARGDLPARRRPLPPGRVRADGPRPRAAPAGASPGSPGWAST